MTNTFDLTLYLDVSLLYCSDSPLDLKIKSNMLSDLFSLTGMFTESLKVNWNLFFVKKTFHCENMNQIRSYFVSKLSMQNDD